MPNTYLPEIGMQDSFGNKMTVGGSLDKPRKKVNRKVIIPLIVMAIIIIFVIIGINIYNYNRPRTHDESLALARQDAKAVIEQEFFMYRNQNTWYANECKADNGDNKFIFYCHVYGRWKTGGYDNIRMYVGIELQKGSHYNYWLLDDNYPFENNTDQYVQELKNKMGW